MTGRSITLFRMASNSAMAVALLLAAASACAQTRQYQGVNWADPRDNFADDALHLSGLDPADDPVATRVKARRMAEQFDAVLGANTIRIPINPATVDSDRWPAYRGLIDGLRAYGASVIVAYWEGTDRNGRIDDQAAFERMWETVVSTYHSDPGIVFEPMNEPHGYTLAEWSALAAEWVARFDSRLPRRRMLIDGTGYSADVRGLCTDPRLDGTLLGVHNYAFWTTRSYDQWLADWRGQLGACPERTVVTEYGVTMNTGHDFSRPSSDNEVMFLQAANRVIRESGVGALYWPGLRDGDGYALTTRRAGAADITLDIVNPSGLDSIHWGWGR